MKRTFGLLAAAVTAATLTIGHADAQTVHRDWEAHGQEEYCYNVSFPTSSTHASRPYRTYVATTQRPLQGVQDEISFVSGLNPNADFMAEVQVDGHQPFTLLVHEGSGFVSVDEEPKLLQQMLRGYKMTVTWAFQTDQQVVDSYSLMGFTASRNAARKAC